MNNLIKELRILKEKCIKDHYDKLNTNKPIQMFYNDFHNREEYAVDGILFLVIKGHATVKDNSVGVDYVDLTEYWLDLNDKINRIVGDRNEV